MHHHHPQYERDEVCYHDNNENYQQTNLKSIIYVIRSKTPNMCKI